jgi:PA14 domain
MGACSAANPERLQGCSKQCELVVACRGMTCLSSPRRDVVMFAAALLAASCSRAPEAAKNSAGAGELQQADLRAQLCSSANAVGVGLRGEYFSTIARSGPPDFVRVDASIDFDGSLDWPSSRAAQRPRSVRWQGWIKAPIAGRYRFHAEPLGATVEVAKAIVTGEEAPAEAVVEMAAGRFYPIILSIDDVGAAQRVRLEWTMPHGGRGVVPRALLFLPTG